VSHEPSEFNLAMCTVSAGPWNQTQNRYIITALALWEVIYPRIPVTASVTMPLAAAMTANFNEGYIS